MDDLAASSQLSWKSTKDHLLPDALSADPIHPQIRASEEEK
jgi:hypothetical protein